MRKLLTILLITVLSTATVLANGSSEKTVAENKPVTVYLVHSKQEISKQLDEAIAAYTASHPNVNIVAEFLSDYTTTIKTKFNGGDEPDVFTITGYTDTKLWQEYLEDLSAEPWAKDIIDIARDGATIDGKLYAFPLCLEGYGYMYNADLLASAGITEMPATRADFEAIVSQLERIGIQPLVELYSSYYQLGNFWTNVGFARQEDPVAFIEGLNNGTETFVGNKEFIDLANFLLYDTAHAKDALNTTFSLQVSNFAKAQAAMTLGGNWNEPTLEGAGASFRYGLMPICINDDVQKNDNLFVGVSVYWGINKNADPAVKAAAKDFFDWLACTKEGQGYMTDVMRLVPPFSGFDINYEKYGYLSRDLLSHMEENKVLGMYYNFFPAGGPQALGTVTQKLVGGQLTVEQYLVELQAAWDNLL